MKKAIISLVLMLLLVQCIGCGSDKANAEISDEGDLAAATSGLEAETETEPLTEESSSEAENKSKDNEAVFLWKGYTMTFPCMTVDLTEYGLDDFQGDMVLVRLAALEGTFTYRDFKQNLFELVDADGNVYPCKFFVAANASSSPVLEGIPEDQQEHIDMLFEMSDATGEKLATADMNIYEQEGEQPSVVSLKSVPQEVPGKEAEGETASSEEGAPETEQEYVTLSYDGNRASVTVDSVFLDDDGKLSVVLKGTGYSFNGVLPIRNGQLVVAFGVDVMVGGTRYSWHTASFGSGTVTYYTDARELPEQILLYSNDNKDEEFAFDADPFITNQAYVGESETVDGSELTALGGQWSGAGQPVGGGEQIFLEINLQEDGTGTYLFRQGDYSESYPVFVNDSDGKFSVDIPADNTLQITGCGGTYEFDGEVLTLHIVTEFVSGRSFAYDVDCERVSPTETVLD